MMSIIDDMPIISPLEQEEYKILSRWTVTMKPADRGEKSISEEKKEEEEEEGEEAEEEAEEEEKGKEKGQRQVGSNPYDTDHNNQVDITIIQHGPLKVVTHEFSGRVLPEKRLTCRETEVYEVTAGIHDTTGEEAVFWSSSTSRRRPINGMQLPLAPITQETLKQLKAHFSRELMGKWQRKEDKANSKITAAFTPGGWTEGSWATQEDVMASLGELGRPNFQYLFLSEEEAKEKEKKKKKEEDEAAPRFTDAVNFVLGSEETVPGSLKDLVARGVAVGAEGISSLEELNGIKGLLQTKKAPLEATQPQLLAEMDPEAYRGMDLPARDCLYSLSRCDEIHCSEPLRSGRWKPMNFESFERLYKTFLEMSFQRMATMISDPHCLMEQYNDELEHHWGWLMTAGDEACRLPQFVPHHLPESEGTWRWDCYSEVLSTTLRRHMTDLMMLFDLAYALDMGKRCKYLWEWWYQPSSLVDYERGLSSCISTVAKGYMIHLIRDVVRRGTFICAPGVRKHFVRTSRNEDTLREDGSLPRSVMELTELEIVEMTEEHAAQSPELRAQWESRPDTGNIIQMHRVLERIDAEGDIKDTWALAKQLREWITDKTTRRFVTPLMENFVETMRLLTVFIDPQAVYGADLLDTAIVSLRKVTGQVPCLYSLRELHEFQFEDWTRTPKFHRHRFYSYMDYHARMRQASPTVGPSFDCDDVAAELFEFSRGLLDGLSDQRLSLPLIPLDWYKGRLGDINGRVDEPVIFESLMIMLNERFRKATMPIKARIQTKDSSQAWVGLEVPPTPQELMWKRLEEEEQMARRQRREETREQRERESRLRRAEEDEERRRRAKAREAVTAKNRERYEAKMRLLRQAEERDKVEELGGVLEESVEDIESKRDSIKLYQKPRVDDAACNPKDRPEGIDQPPSPRQRGISDTMLDSDDNDSDTGSGGWDVVDNGNNHDSHKTHDDDSSDPESFSSYEYKPYEVTKQDEAHQTPATSTCPNTSHKGRIQRKHWDKIETLFGRQPGGLTWPGLECALHHLGYAHTSSAGGSAVKFIWTEVCLWPLSDENKAKGLGALSFHRIHHNKDIDSGILGNLRNKLHRNGIDMEFVEKYYEMK